MSNGMAYCLPSTDAAAMEPIPAIAAIVTATAMAIFSGDIPGCLLRIPGTPASAAYTDEAYAMTLKGQAETALGAGLWFSAVGGLFGTLVMIFMAPSLAEVAIKFSSFEYFWLVVLGLASAVFIGASSVVKALISLLLGLLVACIGLENPAGHPRFTFGVTDLLSGVELIPMMVGMPRAQQVLFVAAVFAAQVAFSHWWLARFRYGPMEWLWRAITYWTIPRMALDKPTGVPAVAGGV